MTPKPPTVAQLKRKIERLEAEVEMLRRFRQIDAKAHNEYAYRAIDAETRIKQAIEILNGETDLTDTNKERAEFEAWANGKGYDIAGTYDTDRSRWVWLNPMTADLWDAWQARAFLLAASAPVAPAPHPDLRVQVMEIITGVWDHDTQIDDATDDVLDLAAAPKAAPGDALDEAMRERDDAEDFIDELLDEVLGADRPEWSSAYNRYNAMDDVRERITALHKPAADKAWGRFGSATAEPKPSPAAQGDALSDAVRVPLNSLHADAAYLIGRLRDGSMPYARVIEIIRERIDAASPTAQAAGSVLEDAAPAQPVAWLVYLPSIDTQHLYYSQEDMGYVDDVTNHADAEVTPLYEMAAPKAEVEPAGEYPPLPAKQALYVFKGKDGEREEVHGYDELQMWGFVDADRAMRAQAAPQPAVQQGAGTRQEPVAWQSRTRPTWGSNTTPWYPWEICTKEQAEDYWKTPLLHGWAYEARALCIAPQAAPVAQGDAEQRQMDAKHAAIYRWMLSNVPDAWNIINNWCLYAEAGTDELHDALAARAQAKEGDQHG